MTDARGEVLRRIRVALASQPEVPGVPRDYRRALSQDIDLVDLFAERVADYRATVTRVPADGLDEAVSARCAERQARRIAVAPGVEARIGGVELVSDDPPLPVERLDEVDGVLTGCALAIAETGTIVLDASPLCGRRALTLVPDLYLCVVRAAQVVGTVPEAMSALRDAAADGRPITMVSGPSATSDIELQRVEGVHGPRTLEVLIVGDA